MSATGRLWLASASPRRRQLLLTAGVDAQVLPADIDDALLRRPTSCPARHWVLAMAYLKGRRVAELLADRGDWSDDAVLAADTVCVHRGRVLGKPRDARHAAAMLRELRNDTHQTITGVCVIERCFAPRRADPMRPPWLVHRRLWGDAAIVTIGSLSDAQIDQYIACGQWRGKAGGYNLEERLEAGWPIECQGDPTTVMGLPMQRLTAWLQQRTAA